MTPLEIGLMMVVMGGIGLWISSAIDFDTGSVAMAILLGLVSFLLVAIGIGYPLYHFFWAS
jgi:hypothetical protein